ncbi:MAG: KH domain-containing protein [archaeon]|mgnify:CR=1 FL=1
MEEIVKIPDERIGILIGPKGTVKKFIEKKTKVTLHIESSSGDVLVSGSGESFFKAAGIVKAIGRGFSPERAYKLLENDYLLKIIEITNYSGKNHSKQEIKRGRIIGRKGLIRKEIEKKTHSLVSVYGKTVAIIARIEDLQYAIEAVEMLLEGAEHTTMEQHLNEFGKERFRL